MHVRYLLAELGVTGDLPLLATALMAPLEAPILDQQVRIEGLDVDRVYARLGRPRAPDRRPPASPPLTGRSGLGRLTWWRRRPNVSPSTSAPQDASITLCADADGDPRRLAVGGLDQHPGDRVGAVALVEDPHLVVDQLELRDLRVGLPDRLAQRVVERVDRAVALAGDDVPHAAGAQLHGRLGDRLVAAARSLGDHPPRLDVEVRRPRALDLLDQQQLERRVRGLEGVAARLQRLDPVGDPGDQLLVAATRSKPSSRPLSSIEARPAMSETSSRMSLPTPTGSMCW